MIFGGTKLRKATLPVNPIQQRVLTLLQAQPGTQAVLDLGLLGAGDWGAIVASADALGVSPMLLRSIDRLGVDVPEQIRARMFTIVQAHTAKNMRILSEFHDLAVALQERGLPFLPVKGVHLCTSLYENIGERAMWDIDLLVRLEQMRAVIDVVEGIGYKASRPFDLDLEVRSYHHVPAFLKKGAPPLEIHWTLLNPRFQNGLNWEELWGRSVVEQLAQVKARVLSAEDLLVYLCAHVAYQHLYIDALRSLYDIKLLVSKHAGEMDWGAITARARTWGLGKSVYTSLRLTEQLLGCEVPDSAWQALRPTDFREVLLEAASRRVLEHSDRSPVVSAVWSRRSLPQRLAGLWGRLMVPRSVLAGRYHLQPDSWKVNLYYFARAWDLLKVHGGELLELLLGRRSGREVALRESELIAYLNWWQQEK